MNRVFVDTSAILALLVPTDEAHPRARRAFNRLRAVEAPLVTTSYVLVETYALLGRRFGLDTVRSFRDDFAPLMDVIWIDRDLHERALDFLLSRHLRDLSLVDAASLLVVRDRKIDSVFAYNGHFEAEGFPSLE